MTNRLRLAEQVRVLRKDGTEDPFSSRKVRALAAYVSLHPRGADRERLAGLLWGDRDGAQARASLRQALYSARRAAGADAFHLRANLIMRDRSRLETDVELFDRLALEDRWDELSLEVQNWRPPLLEGLDGLSDELDEWLQEERRALPEKLIADCIAAADEVELSDPQAGSRIVDALQRFDPLNEALALIGVRFDLAAGNRASAARRVDSLTADLRKQLQIAPSPETLEAFDRIRSPVPVSGREDPKSATVAVPGETRSPSRARLRLPLVLIALVGLLAAAAYFTVWSKRDPASIAVLPFDGATPTTSMLARGLSDEILNDLGRQRDLKVLGRFSGEIIRRSPDPIAAARRLGIDAVLDGSVRWNGDRLLVFVRLVRTADGVQLSSQRFDRAQGDIIAIQDEIASMVVAGLGGGTAAAEAGRQTSPAVYQRYAAARALARERRPATLEAADRLLREAIRLDPNFAPGYAELSQVSLFRAKSRLYYGDRPLSEARAEAERLARKAIALDPQLGDGWAALGLVKDQWAGARSEYAKAVALNPQRSEFHRWYGQALQSSYRFDEAVQQYRDGVDIDPLWGVNTQFLIGGLASVGKLSEARDAVRRFERLSTDERAVMEVQTLLASYSGDVATVFRLTERMHREFPGERLTAMMFAASLAGLGERKSAAAIDRDDPIGSALLRNDIRALSASAEAGCPAFRELNYDWSGNRYISAAGQGRLLVQWFDRCMASDEGDFDKLEATTNIYTILALREAGRLAAANRLTAHLEWQIRQLPRQGYSKFRRDSLLLDLAIARGDRELAGKRLLELVRSHASNFRDIPAAPLTSDPRFSLLRGSAALKRADTGLLLAINDTRSEVGLNRLSAGAWAALGKP